MNTYLNDYSLNGQYDSIEEFYCEVKGIVECARIITEAGGKVYKNSDFYSKSITKDYLVSDLKKFCSCDEQVRLALFFDSVYDKPFWDDEPKQDLYHAFFWEDKDVSLTAMAEAAVMELSLLSFKLPGLMDSRIDITEQINEAKTNHSIHSIYSVKYLIQNYNDEFGFTNDHILQYLYADTRIDCSRIEPQFGANNLEQGEFQLIKGTFDKFIKHESFDSIALDDGLKYKKYDPQGRKNWFVGPKYRLFTIMKFRCSDTIRVFGYRKEDKFRVLRIERDHSVSDFG